MPFERGAEKLRIGHLTTAPFRGRLNEAQLSGIKAACERHKLDFTVLAIEAPNQAPGTATSTSQQVRPESETGKLAGHQVTKQAPYSFTPLVDSDLALTAATWTSSIVLSVSDWIQVDKEGLDGSMRLYYCQAFRQQLEWAVYCCAYATILPTPSASSESSCANYAALISHYLHGNLTTQLWVRIPLLVQTAKDSKRSTDAWRVWSELKRLVGPSNLGVALMLAENLPTNLAVLDRWMAEPVRAVIIPSRLFHKESSGNLSLPPTQKQFVERLMRLRVQVIIQHEAAFDSVFQMCPSFPDSSSVTGPSLLDFSECIGRIFMGLPSLTEVRSDSL